MTRMLVTTQDSFEDRRITETLGLARGNVVRSRFFGRDIVAGFRALVGGEIPEYTKLMAEAREEALDRMIAHAEALGADAIVGVRFQTSMIMDGAAEMMAFGTAVKLAPQG